MNVTLPFTGSKPAAVLFGAECHLTASVLAEMLARGMPIAGIVLSGPPNMDSPLRPNPPGQRIRLLASPAQPLSVAEIAASNRIDVYRIGNMRSRQSLELLHSLGADYLLSVCFPRRIPTVAIDAIAGPALNLHPSLLPKLRGPDPMFWTFHAGDGAGGLTLHELSETLDAGPIAAQRAIAIPDGTTERELERMLTPVAVDMLDDLLSNMSTGQLELQPQAHHLASYAPFPEQDDYTMQPAWSARRGFNFVRGIAGRGEPVQVEVAGTPFRIVSVSEYTGQPDLAQDDLTLLEMADGYLAARLALLQD